jgi:hypothetical protein
MPIPPYLQTAIISEKVLNQGNGALCRSKMLVSSLRELHIETSMEAATLPIEPNTCSSWLRPIHQICSGLSILSLNVRLPSSAIIELSLVKPSEISPWCPTPTMLMAVGKLGKLSHLDMILDCHHPLGLQNYAVITSVELLALLKCPLKTLSISAYRSEQEYMLGLQQVSGAELLYLLSKIQPLSSLQLNIGCDKITCDTQQKETNCQLLKDLHLSNFRVGTFTDVDYVEPDVWLGSNCVYCPDPLQREPRQLHHGPKAQGTSYMEENAADRDELLVWGDGVELETEHDISEQLGAEAEKPTAAAYSDVINELGRNIAESGCSKSYWSHPARGRRG